MSESLEIEFGDNLETDRQLRGKEPLAKRVYSPVLPTEVGINADFGDWSWIKWKKLDVILKKVLSMSAFSRLFTDFADFEEARGCHDLPSHIPL